MPQLWQRSLSAVDGFSRGFAGVGGFSDGVCRICPKDTKVAARKKEAESKNGPLRGRSRRQCYHRTPCPMKRSSECGMPFSRQMSAYTYALLRGVRFIVR